MKFVHCADIHLDSPLNNLNRKTTLRRMEILQSFCDTVNYASQNANALLISGDLFDGNTVNKATVDSVRSAFVKANNIEIFLLNGNHDKSAYNFNDVLDFPKNVHIFSKKWSYFDIGNVTFAGIDISCADKGFEKLLDLKADNFNVVIMHGDVNKDFDWNELSSKPIDYVALGHYHSYKSTKFGRGVLSYCGTNEPRGFDEIGQCGFNLVDTLTKEISHVDNAKRHIVTVTIDVTNCFSVTDVINLLDSNTSNVNVDDYINVIVVGKRQIDLPLVDTVNARLTKYFSCRIEDKTELQIDMEKLLTESSIEGEFVRVAVSQNYDKATLDKVVEFGLMALKGVIK